MKKQILSLLLILVYLSCSLTAQNSFGYEVGAPYKVVDAYPKYYFSDPEKGKLLSLKFAKRALYIQSFNARTLKEIKREKIKDLPKKYVISTVTKINERIYFFYTIWNKQSTLQQLFVQEIDFDNCRFKGAPKKIFELNERVYFSYLYAHNKSKILIQCRKNPEKKRDAINYDKIGLYVFDEDLYQLAGNEIKMPYTEQQMDNIDYHVDQKGNPYILAKVRKDGSNKDFIGKGKNKVLNYHLELLKINIKKGSIKVSRIKLEGNRIENIWLYEGRDKNIICSGFYNKEESSGENADGVFLFKVDKDGGIREKKFYEIPLEIINQHQHKKVQKKNEKKEKKDKAEFESLVMRKLIVQEDNSILLVGEQYFVVQHTYTDANGNTRTRYSYHYYDILVTKINSEGELVWMRKLPKRQVGGSPYGGMGIKHMSINEKHYFVYLDNVKNLNLPLDKSPVAHRDGKGGYLTAYRLNDETGKVSKVSIFDTRDVKGGYKVYQFQTDRMLPVSEDEFIIEFYKKQKEDILIKIKVK